MRNKEVRLSVRTSEATVADLKTTARLRGLSVSSLVNMLVVKAIREEKAIVPEEFERKTDEAANVEKAGIRRGKGDWRIAAKELQALWKDRDDLPDLIREIRQEADQRIER